MAESETLSFRADEDLRADVETHKARNGYDTLSKATEELVRTGLRESKTPWLYRWKEAALDAAFYLLVTAVVVVAIGVVPNTIPRVGALQVAAVLLVMGAVLVAAVELARTFNGQNEIGGAIWGGRE